MCNPCVPDPNIAPPQTPQFEHQRRPTPSHTRSASLASPNFDGHQGPRTSQGEANRPSFEYLLSSFQRRPREPSILGGNPPSRVPSASHSQSHTGSLGSHSPAGDSQGFRSRSSTVCLLRHRSLASIVFKIEKPKPPFANWTRPPVIIVVLKGHRIQPFNLTTVP